MQAEPTASRPNPPRTASAARPTSTGLAALPADEPRDAPGLVDYILDGDS